MLDVRRLRVLREVVESGSVTAAARRLSYAPSAVSQHVAALERETGTALLERVGRGVRPTAAGRLLAEHAAGVLARIEDAEQALAALRAGRVGRLAVASFPTAGVGLLPAAVRDFRRRCPDVELGVTLAEEAESLAALQRGEVELALVVAADPAADDAGLTRLHLLDDPFRVVLPRQHPLARRRAVPLAALADEGWVTASRTSTLCEQQATDACADAGFRPRSAIEADDYPTAQAYVAAGLGVALVPLLALGAVHEGVVARRIQGTEPRRRVEAVTRPALVRDGPVPQLLEALRTAAAEQRRAAAR